MVVVVVVAVVVVVIVVVFAAVIVVVAVALRLARSYCGRLTLNRLRSSLRHDCDPDHGHDHDCDDKSDHYGCANTASAIQNYDCHNQHDH